MKSRLAGCGFGIFCVTAAFAQGPKITGLQNNYSYILPGMPNYGIAQGSIFDIFGTGLAASTSALQGVPLPTSLGGTSVSITVNGVVTHAILYFVSPAQIAAILPSATPTGTGTITVTLNGQTGPAAPITVVQSAFGMLSLNGAGNGPAAVFDVNSNYLGLTNAANPGDVITLWGSGVGPVTGDETVQQTPVNLTNIPLEVDIGGVSATIQYRGRSIYPGLDQINVIVPQGVNGCQVSVVARSGSIVSNFGLIPVSASGRICSDPAPGGLTASQIQTLSSQANVNQGVVAFMSLNGSDSAGASFVRYSGAQFAADQPIGGIPFNDCTVVNYVSTNMSVPSPASLAPVSLDAGATISLTPPSTSGIGNQSLNSSSGYAVANLTSPGSMKGTYTFTGTGGADVGPFTAQVTWPGGGGGFTFSTPGNANSVVRSQGLTVTWSQPSNTDPSEFIQLSGFAFVPNMPQGAEFACNVPLATGQFTIPPAVLLALPSQAGLATPQAQLAVDLIITAPFTARGLDFAVAAFLDGSAEVFSYQ